MPNYTLFFKPVDDKNGNTYFKARTRSGKIKAQLFRADKDDIAFTCSIQLPRRMRSFRGNNGWRRNNYRNRY